MPRSSNLPDTPSAAASGQSDSADAAPAGRVRADAVGRQARRLWRATVANRNVVIPAVSVVIAVASPVISYIQFREGVRRATFEDRARAQESLERQRQQVLTYVRDALHTSEQPGNHSDEVGVLTSEVEQQLRGINASATLYRIVAQIMAQYGDQSRRADRLADIAITRAARSGDKLEIIYGHRIKANVRWSENDFEGMNQEFERALEISRLHHDNDPILRFDAAFFTELFWANRALDFKKCDSAAEHRKHVNDYAPKMVHDVPTDQLSSFDAAYAKQCSPARVPVATPRAQ